MNTAANQLECHRCCRVKIENRVQFLRPDDLVLFDRPRKCAGLAKPLTVGQERLAPAQLLFRLFAFFNVGQKNIPVEDSPFRVAQREPSRLEPAIYAIEAPESLFDIERTASGQ